MVKFYAFILSCLSIVSLATPAQAGRLLFWRFDDNQNRLTFTTDQGVQPTAQLIANPTRLVIDLPGTVLGRPTINESYRGVITSLRIGQFNSNTTRVVVELAQGYVLDPQQIKVKGISPTQWAVDLPNPQRGNFPSSQNNSSNNTSNQTVTRPVNPPTNNQTTTTNNTSNSSTSSGDDGLLITSSGLVVNLNGSYQNGIEIERSQDRREITIEIDQLKVPTNLIRSWQVNQYGVSEVNVTQTNENKATVTMKVDRDSPEWQATFMRTGGLLIWPQGGVSRVKNLSSPQVISNNNNNNNNNSKSISVISPSTNSNNNVIEVSQRPTTTNTTNNNQTAILDYLQISYNQLLIKSNVSIQAKANWINGNKVYQIRLENTKLSPVFQDPTLPKDSPIARLRILEPNDKTVILEIEPANDTQIQRLNQLRNNLWTLALNKDRNFARQIPINTRVPINQGSLTIDPFNNTPTRNNTNPNSIAVTPSRPTTINPSAVKSKAVVFIDPGHGGKDPGAIGIGGIQEKRIVMAISQKVAQILEQQGIQVRMTRDSDYFVSLAGRTNMANKANADLFVSIHANSAGSNKPQVSGYETYYFQTGKGLADVIHRNVLRRVDVRDRKVRQARFYVLRKSSMPSVLVETGFLTGTEDAAKLTNPTYQTQMAQAIASGIIEYIQANRL